MVLAVEVELDGVDGVLPEDVGCGGHGADGVHEGH